MKTVELGLDFSPFASGNPKNGPIAALRKVYMEYQKVMKNRERKEKLKKLIKNE